MKAAQENKQFEILLDYLQRNRGFDFSAYKRPSLMRLVSKRMQMNAIKDFSDYQDFLEVHPDEFVKLFNTILINVTAFFRDQPAWDFLSAEIIPNIIKSKKSGDPIRVWSAGCASGEEAYSIAMLLAEALGAEAFRDRVKIYATDVDEEALTQARQAAYTEKQMEPVPPAWRKKYFEQSGTHHIFCNDLRRMVIFGRHDLIVDAPISRLDLLACRNTLMYFNAEAQSQILARFHFALDDPGYLFLGKAEMLLTHTGLFSPIELKHRIFTRVHQISVRDRMLVMAQAGTMEAENYTAPQVRLRDVAFDTGMPAQLLVDSSHTLAFANDRARAVFNLSQQDQCRPLQDLEISYRPLELRTLIEQCESERRTITVERVERTQPDNKSQYFGVRVMPLMDNGSFLGVSITFEDRSLYYKLQEEVQRHQQELETALEELQSANEELETTNEELQSTNEEMETMNEELQSTNQELQAVNIELSQRTEEVKKTNVFLQSILNSLRDGVVVLDTRMDVIAWNHRAEDLWGIRSDEALGQTLLGLDIGLPVEKLTKMIRSCLAGKGENEEVTLDATTRKGKGIVCRVNCSPIVDSSKDIHGIILLMEEK
jgi:two-component system CheB/CheR fusion protein